MRFEISTETEDGIMLVDVIGYDTDEEEIEEQCYQAELEMSIGSKKAVVTLYEGIFRWFDFKRVIGNFHVLKRKTIMGGTADMFILELGK